MASKHKGMKVAHHNSGTPAHMHKMGMMKHHIGDKMVSPAQMMGHDEEAGESPAMEMGENEAAGQ